MKDILRARENCHSLSRTCAALPPQVASMSELVFFYGTLMTPFNRPARQRVDPHLAFAGRGSIGAALFDLGIYPAAVPTSDGCVWGELYEILQPSVVLAELAELEGFRA